MMTFAMFKSRFLDQSMVVQSPFKGLIIIYTLVILGKASESRNQAA